MSYYKESLKLKAGYKVTSQYNDLSSAVVAKIIRELRDSIFTEASDSCLNVRDDLFGGTNKVFNTSVDEAKKFALEKIEVAKDNIKKEFERALKYLVDSSNVNNIDSQKLQAILDSVGSLLTEVTSDLSDVNLFRMGINSIAIDDESVRKEFTDWFGKEFYQMFDKTLRSVDWSILPIDKKEEDAKVEMQELESTKSLVDTEVPKDGGIEFRFEQHPEFYPVIQGTPIKVADEESAKELIGVLGNIADQIVRLFGGNIILYMNEYSNNSNFKLVRIVSSVNAEGNLYSLAVDPNNLMQYVGIVRENGNNTLLYPTVPNAMNEFISTGMNDPYSIHVKNILLQQQQAQQQEELARQQAAQQQVQQEEPKQEEEAKQEQQPA